MKDLGPLLIPLIIIVLMWVVLIRPANKQRRQQMEVQRQLAVGERIVLSSGIFGTITKLEDSRAWVSIAPQTEIEVARQVVVRRAEDAPDAAPDSRTRSKSLPETATTEDSRTESGI